MLVRLAVLRGCARYGTPRRATLRAGTGWGVRPEELNALHAYDAHRRHEPRGAADRARARPPGHGRPGRDSGSFPGWPPPVRLPGRGVRAPPEPEEGGRGVPIEEIG